MVASNGTNGNGHVADATRSPSGMDNVMRLPTIDELKRAHEEGLPQTLLSGLEVQLRPLQPDKLLMAGNVPDILTPLLLSLMFPAEKKDERVFPDEADSPVTAYLSKPRDEAKEALAFVQSVNLVCEAALIDASIVPYLSVADRMWIFRLAWLPVAVLASFRLQPQTDVAAGDDSGAEPLPTEPAIAVDSGA